MSNELREALEEFYDSCIRNGKFDHESNARYFIRENKHMGVSMSDLPEIVDIFKALDEEHTTPKMIYFNFKLTPADKAQLKKDAYRHEMNISEYLRWLISKQREEDSRGE